MPIGYRRTPTGCRASRSPAELGGNVRNRSFPDIASGSATNVGFGVVSGLSDIDRPCGISRPYLNLLDERKADLIKPVSVSFIGAPKPLERTIDPKLAEGVASPKYQSVEAVPVDPRKKGMIGSDQAFDAILRKLVHPVPQFVSLQQFNIY